MTEPNAETTQPTDTSDSYTELVIVAKAQYDGTWVVAGHLTPDLDIEPYLASMWKLGYRDAHIARRTVFVERVDLETAEAERSVYPPQYADQTKVTKSVGQ